MDTVVENQPKHGIGSVIKESWELTKGFKWTALKVILSMIIVLVAVELLFFYFFQPEMFHPNPVTHQYPPISPYLSLIVSYITWLFVIPLSVMGLRRAIGLPAKAGAAFKTMFNSFSSIIGIIIVLMLIAFVFGIFANYMMSHHSFVITVLYVIALLVNILIGLTGLFATLLIITKKVKTVDAVSQSFAGVKNHISLVLGSYVLMVLILIISIIPLLIGLVWTLPMSFILPGILFRNIYGVKNGVSLSNAQPGASEYTY